MMIMMIVLVIHIGGNWDKDGDIDDDVDKYGEGVEGGIDTHNDDLVMVLIAWRIMKNIKVSDNENIKQCWQSWWTKKGK